MPREQLRRLGVEFDAYSVLAKIVTSVATAWHRRAISPRQDDIGFFWPRHKSNSAHAFAFVQKRELAVILGGR